MVRGATEVSGLRDIRTMHSSKKRSIPRVQSSAYLDLYLLRKEKDRLEKEVYILDKRKNSIQKRIDEIELEMNKLQEAEVTGKASTNSSSSGHSLTQKDGVKKRWKKMPLTY